MDKEFWVAIAKNDYAVPEGHTLAELTKILFSYLGSTDPELRDDIAYIVYANWLKREIFTKEQIRAHVDELLSNLEKGIGETESDSVFCEPSPFCFWLRSFITITRSCCSKENKSKPFSRRDCGISTPKKTRADISLSKAGHTRWHTPRI